MDAIIGRYQVGLKETGLILQHEAGIAFDLTREESLALFTLLHAYYETLLALKDGLEPEKVIRVVIADAKEDEHA